MIERTLDPGVSLQPSPAGRRTFAFAAAMPPRAEQLFPSDGWLEAIARSGYTHVCLQNDHFFHPEMELRDYGENVCRLFFLFDFISGPRRRTYQAWLAAVDRRCGDFGLKLAVELWEPRLSRLARRMLPAEWMGPAHPDGWYQMLCVGHPDARRWLLEGFQSLLRVAPRLDTVILGINDNSALLCDERCPRCAPTPVFDRLGSLYRDVETACHGVRTGCRLMPYDWMWDQHHYEAVFSRLARPPAVLTRLERHAEYLPDPSHPEWKAMVFDQSLSCDSIGTDFLASKKAMAARGGDILIMPTPSGMFESWMAPHVPAVGRLAKKFDLMRREGVAGWVDFDCGGVTEGLMLDLISVIQRQPQAGMDKWLSATANMRYGEVASAAAAREAWAKFDAALGWSPCALEFDDVTCFSGRFSAALAILPMHPFLPQRLVGTYAKKKIMHFDPHLLATPKSIPALRHLLPKMVEDGTAGLEAYDRVIQSANGRFRDLAEVDRLIGELAVLTWRSAANFSAWAAAILGDKTVDLFRTLADEIGVVRRYREISYDARIDHGNMTHHWERAIALSVPQASADLYHAVECDHLASWTDPNPVPHLSGDFFAWKIAHLEQQISQV